MSMVEVRVPNLGCEGCASKLKKALLKLKGAEEVEIEMEIQKITVRGYALEEKKVLKAIKRAGKAAEPWPFPGYSHFASFYKYPTYIVNHYYEYDTYKNVATNGVHTFFHTPSVYSVAVASDETRGEVKIYREGGKKNSLKILVFYSLYFYFIARYTIHI